MHTWLVAASALFSLVAAGTAIALFWRVRPTGTSLVGVVDGVRAPVVRETTVNPLAGLSFDDSLATNALACIAGRHLGGADPSLWLQPASGLAAITAAGMAAARTIGGKYIDFPRDVRAMLETGQAKLMVSQGRELAVAVGTDERVRGIARVVGPSAAGVAVAAYAAVVSGAHLIANADNARSLRRIESKLDRLISLRESDMLARLEALYYGVRELPWPPPEASRTRVAMLLDGLRTLRVGWRRQIQVDFSHIDDAGWLERHGFGPGGNKAKEQADNLTPLLMAVKYALALEAALILGNPDSDTAEAFLAGVAEEGDLLADCAARLDSRWRNRGKSAEKAGTPALIADLRLTADRYVDVGKAADRARMLPS